MTIRRIFGWLARPREQEPYPERPEDERDPYFSTVDDDIQLSEAVGDDGGGGISAGRSSTRSGAGLGFRPRFAQQQRR